MRGGDGLWEYAESGTWLGGSFRNGSVGYGLEYGQLGGSTELEEQGSQDGRHVRQHQPTAAANQRP
jgi:hypothetical protein